VVCDNLLFMRAKILRQNMQQGVLGLLKVNIELLLLVLAEVLARSPAERSRLNPTNVWKGPEPRRSGWPREEKPPQKRTSD
jgi:hypothetical protein